MYDAYLLFMSEMAKSAGEATTMDDRPEFYHKWQTRDEAYRRRWERYYRMGYAATMREFEQRKCALSRSP